MKTWEDYYPENSTNGFGFVSRPREEFRKYFFETGKPDVTGGKLMDTTVRREKGIRSVDWNCEGRYYASGTKDGYVVVQDLHRLLDTKQRMTTMFEMTASSDRYAEVSNVRWHPHEPNIIATVAGDKLKIWDVRLKGSDSCIASVEIRNAEGKPAGHGLNLRWYPTGTQLYVGTSDDWMITYSFSLGESKKMERIALFKFDYVVNEFDIDPSGSMLVACNDTGAVDVFAISAKQGASGVSQQGKKGNVQAHSVSVFSIDTEPNGRFFAIGSADSIVSFMTRDLECMGCFSVCRDEIRSISFSHDGELTCVASKNELYIIHSVTQKIVFKLPELRKDENYYAARWHPKRNILLYCTDAEHDSGHVYFWMPNIEMKEIRESMN